MIAGGRPGARLLPRAATLALALGAALTVSTGLPAEAAAGRGHPRADRAAAPADAPAVAPGGWARAWAWRSGSGGLPKGCAPYSGRTSTGMRWSPSLVRMVHGRVGLATTGGTAQKAPAGSGLGCTGRPQRYGRLEVRARMPQGRGLVGRIALWPSTVSRGSDWSGLTVPSADVGPAYATNGCGDEAHGAAVPARLAGAFHDYLITWSPHGFSRGRRRPDPLPGRHVVRPAPAGSASAWPPPAGRPPRAQLLVEKVVAFRWTGPLAPAGGTALDAVSSTPDVLDGTRLSGPWLIGGGAWLSASSSEWLGRRGPPGDARSSRGEGRPAQAPGDERQSARPAHQCSNSSRASSCDSGPRSRCSSLR